MRRVGLIVVPDVGALSVFELANAKSAEPHYDLVVMSEHGGAVRNSLEWKYRPNHREPAYHPRTLLKIYVYGYLNRVQSSRRLERECQRNTSWFG